MVAFAPGGAVVVGMTSLVGVLGGLAAFNFGSLNGMISGLADGLHKLEGALGFGGDNKSPLGGDIPSSRDLIQKQNFNPGMPPRTDGQPLHVHLHVDGQDVAQVVTRVQMAQARFPSQAPYHDSYASYSPPDVNLQWG
jgi:hypothetical protein